jgi:excinuclease UvrABC nuclease subunit
MGDREAAAVHSMLSKLMRAPTQSFPKPRTSPDAPKMAGVYVIHGPTGTVLHVGRGCDIAQRLRDHLFDRSAFTAKYLSGNGSILRQGHSFRYLVVSDARKRALLEALAIGKLCPKHIGHGWIGRDTKS